MLSSTCTIVSVENRVNDLTGVDVTWIPPSVNRKGQPVKGVLRVIVTPGKSMDDETHLAFQRFLSALDELKRIYLVKHDGIRPN
jgi:hypothetical protein